MDKRKFSEREKEEFRRFADDHSPKSKLLPDCIVAFLVGGAICVAGQGIFDLILMLGAPESDARVYTSVALIFLSCLFTGIGWYDKLARHAGAGTLVPITGFANAVSSCAIDAKAEGYVLGVGAKMFTIAGPVIVYGSVATILWGLIYYFFL